MTTAGRDARTGGPLARGGVVRPVRVHSTVEPPELVVPLVAVGGHADYTEHTPEGREAITAELVACTLGARQRTELRTDVSGKLAHTWGRVREALGPLVRASLAAQSRAEQPPTWWQRLRRWLAC